MSIVEVPGCFIRRTLFGSKYAALDEGANTRHGVWTVVESVANSTIYHTT